jgi:hypothetical protein
MKYCADGDVTRRETGDRLGGAKPGGVRKGAGEDDGLCIQQ